MSLKRGSWRWNAGVVLTVLMLAHSSFVLAARLRPGQQDGVPPVAPQEPPAEAQEADELGAELATDAPIGPAPDVLIDPTELPAMRDDMTDDEEDALRLVEEILSEQQLLLSGQNFVYNARGRRDPFRSLLLLRQRELTAPTQRPPGLPGFMVGEIDISALAQFQGRWHAMLVGLDRRTYFAEVGTQLYDGRIVTISEREIVFEQEVEDLLGARSTRQVVKRLVRDEEQ